MVTVFLLVFVIALAIGNGLLFFTGSRRAEGMGSEELGKLKENIIEFAPKNIPKKSKAVEFNPEAKAANQKILMAHERIQELEKKVARLNSAVAKLSEPAKKDLSNREPSKLNEKIERLEEFRNDAKIEIVAIKELLEDLRKTLPLLKKEKKSRKELLKLKKDSEELDKRIHELVFHGGKKAQ